MKIDFKVAQYRQPEQSEESWVPPIASEKSV
jgi:hypothetical protein